MEKSIAIIGGGAAGCFCSICVKRMLPEARVDVYEAGDRPLAKVAVTGGGRCNLTNTFENVSDLAKIYPRGHRFMQRALQTFGHKDIISWFGNEGVRLYSQDDDRVFPLSDDAMQVVRCLTNLMHDLDIHIHTSHRISAIVPISTQTENLQADRSGYTIAFTDPKLKPVRTDIAVVTTGGFSADGERNFLKCLDLELIPPIPSLFTFKLIPDTCQSSDRIRGGTSKDLNTPAVSQDIRTLTGTSVDNVQISLSGTKHKAEGPLLITHWGVSGPAVLRLSSYAAKEMKDSNYTGELRINWIADTAENLSSFIAKEAATAPAKKLSSVRIHGLPAKLTDFLICRSGMRHDIRLGEIGRKGLNRFAEVLSNDRYTIAGRGTNKDEFVTCGGVALPSVNGRTLESKAHPGLFFAGEILDIDAVTGGFNLQAAWTTAYIVSRSI